MWKWRDIKRRIKQKSNKNTIIAIIWAIIFFCVFQYLKLNDNNNINNDKLNIEQHK